MKVGDIVTPIEKDANYREELEVVYIGKGHLIDADYVIHVKPAECDGFCVEYFERDLKLVRKND